jgi:hypothetical protein
MIMLYRQKAYADMRDSLRKPIEVEAKEVRNYVILTVLWDVWWSRCSNGNYGFNQVCWF